MAKTRSGKKSKGSPSKSKRSSVRLRGTEQATAAKKVAKKISIVETKTELANDKIDKEEQRRLKAKNVLDDMESRLRILRNTADQPLKEVRGRKVLPQFEAVFNHLENNSVLRLDDDVAPLGMKLTGRTEMTAKQVAEAESSARRMSFVNPCGTWGYEKTSENCSITQKARHAMGVGLADHNEKQKKHIFVSIPEMAKRYRSIINIMDEGEGVEIHPPGEGVPISYDTMLEKVAHYLRFKSYVTLRSYLVDKQDMVMERFIGDEIIPFTNAFAPSFPRYKIAAIRFKFKAGNETRFEMH